MATRLVEWSILACFPAGVFVLLGVLQLPAFVDPCHSWGDDDASPTAAPTSDPDPACVGRTSTPDTKGQALTRLLLFQGTVLIGMAVAVAGAVRGNRVVGWAGAGLLGIVSLLLVAGFEFVFPLASAVLFAIGFWLLSDGQDDRLEGA